MCVAELTASRAVVRSRDEDDFVEHFPERLDVSTQWVLRRPHNHNTILPFDLLERLEHVFL